MLGAGANNRGKQMSDRAYLGVAEEPGGRRHSVRSEMQAVPNLIRPVGDRLMKVPPRDLTSYRDLHEMFYHSGVASILLDLRLSVRFFTAAAQSMVEISAADIGRPLADLKLLLNDPTLVADARSVITHRPSNREVAGANEIWFMRRAQSCVSRDNRVDGVAIPYPEISELKTAMREIDAARAYSDKLINTLLRPMVVLDDQLQVLFANPAFYATFQTDAPRTIGRYFGLLDNPLTSNPNLHVFLEGVKVDSPAIAESEIEIILSANDHRQFLLRVLRIEGNRSALGKFLFVGEDVTKRNHVAAALEAALLPADEANRGKSHFLAAASHDLRQPLQTMSLLRSLLAARTTDRQSSGLLDRLENTIWVMSGILNTILDINQLESGTVKCRSDEIPDQRAVTAAQGRVCRPHVDARARVACGPMRQCHLQRPSTLAEIMRNLISNAVKYTKKGKVLLGCRRRGDKLRVEVWDTGIGMPETEIGTVFVEFRQLDNATRERNRGLGLGLPIARRLAVLLGHNLDVGSILGKGSVFAIEVPLRQPSSIGPRRGARRRP